YLAVDDFLLVLQTTSLFLTSLDLSNDALVTVDFRVALPEDLRVLFNLLLGLALHLRGNSSIVLAPMTRRCVDKVLKVAAEPVGKALLCKLLLLLLLLFSQRLSIINLRLGIGLLLLALLQSL